MDAKYLLGVAVAIGCGLCNNLGVLLQKKVVNEVPPESREEGFLLTLLRSPLWLFGLFLQVGLGMAAFVVAQGLIGPALVPGLMASGLIVLAVGSVKLIGETLSGSEYLGICLMVVGILLLGLSGLDISVAAVREALALPVMATRIAVFTLGLSLGCGLIHLLARKSDQRKGILMGFSNGFLFSLSNFWISPLLAVIALVLTGQGSLRQTGFFLLASVILVVTNLLGFSQIQYAFKFGQASNIIPVQQISVQTTPILVYFCVFGLQAPKMSSGLLIVAGAGLIILAGFLLGRRQAQLENLR